MSIKIGLIVSHAILLFFMFLLLLNGYLRGELKEKTNLVLTAIITGLLIFIGFKFGLIEALISIPICVLVYRPLTNILAKYISFKILGFRTSISNGKERTFEDIMSGKREKSLDLALKKTSIQKVLHQYGKTEDDFKDHYSKLMCTGVGDLSFDIMSNPKSLSLLFQLKNAGYFF